MPDPFTFDERLLMFLYRNPWSSWVQCALPDGSLLNVGTASCSAEKAEWELNQTFYGADLYKVVERARESFYHEVGGEDLSSHQKVEWFAKAAKRRARMVPA